MRIVFITGTDTGVGKSVLTALLLAHLRRSGCPAVGIKPFCSGSRADARLLHSLQNGQLSLDEVNPYFFDEPVAPLVAARKHRRSIPLQAVLDHIESVASRHLSLASRSADIARPGQPAWSGQRDFQFYLAALLSVPSPVRPVLRKGATDVTLAACAAGASKAGRRPALRRYGPEITQSGTDSWLLIEGAGGLLAPVGEGYSARDLIVRLGCDVIIVARNKIGTINHTLLTLEALGNSGECPAERPSRRARHAPKAHVVLMDTCAKDASRRTNAAILSELLGVTPLVRLPYLGTGVRRKIIIERCARRLSGSLDQLLR